MASPCDFSGRAPNWTLSDKAGACEPDQRGDPLAPLVERGDVAPLCAALQRAVTALRAHGKHITADHARAAKAISVKAGISYSAFVACEGKALSSLTWETLLAMLVTLLSATSRYVVATHVRVDTNTYAERPDGTLTSFPVGHYVSMCVYEPGARPDAYLRNQRMPEPLALIEIDVVTLAHLVDGDASLFDARMAFKTRGGRGDGPVYCKDAQPDFTFNTVASALTAFDALAATRAGGALGLRVFDADGTRVAVEHFVNEYANSAVGAAQRGMSVFAERGMYPLAVALVLVGARVAGTVLNAPEAESESEAEPEAEPEAQAEAEPKAERVWENNKAPRRNRGGVKKRKNK